MKKSLILVVLASLFNTAAIAQTSVPEASKAPLAAMQALASFVGTWSVQMSYSPDDGATWQQLPPAIHEISFREKGLILSERPTEVNPNAFQSAAYFSYDQYRETYRLAVMDDTWGIMDIYEGNIDGGKLVSTNLKSGTFFPVGDGKWRGFKLSLDLTGDSERVMVVEKTDDNGTSWQPNFIITYKKQ